MTSVFTGRGHRYHFFHTRVYEPCPRPVNTGVILDTSEHGPWTRVVCTELNSLMWPQRSRVPWFTKETF